LPRSVDHSRPAPIADLLIEELAAVGFAPDSLLIKLVASRIADRGRCEFALLPDRFHEVGPWRSKCTYHLGIGASLTEFLIAGLELQQTIRLELASLGAIAHTIYAIFDTLLDVSGSVPKLFSEQPEFSANPEIRYGQGILLDLVNLYFEKLNALPSQRAGIRMLIERTIRKLYAAELETATPSEITRKAWWRKNALSIFVMALPAWLSAGEGSNIGFTAHMMWLGRVGEFLGWVDDFSDFERDGESGQTNRLRWLNRSAIQVCAKRTALRGQRAFEVWNSRNSQSAFQNTFRVMVWTSLPTLQPEPHPELRTPGVGVSGPLQ
jgi:hypothetical protein